jgi:WD40 repeat protein/class 3 adenylate cyclase
MDHSPSSPMPFADLPEGTVTFLFTDIEGSTRLLEQLREGYATLLADQRDLLRTAFQKWHGHEVDTQGDSFFVAFGRAADAIACVIEAQQALSEHTWPEGVSVRVRMGLHTGEPMVAHTGYVGIDVHRAARVAAAGHGGQVLLSETTRELVYHDLPSRTGLRDLGEHKLKDLRLPLQLFQLEVEGLPCDFPPLRTLSQPEEPPTPGTAPFKGLQYFGETDADLFFGRSEVTDRLVDTISQQRFLAVVGASGSGKSSVVRAGLVPALKQRQPGNWETFVLTPTVQPLWSLALQLTRASEPETASTTLLDDLRREPHSLHLYLRQRSTEEGKGQILLVVDQLEELFTLCRDADERQAFIDNLLYAAQAPDGRVHVLVALRADFYDHLAEYTELREAVAKNQEYLGAMSAAELRQAIEEPAKLGGWEFTPGLVELMLHEVGAEGERQPEPGALPLLSHALLETWNHRRGNLMSLRAYAESGGVNRAIALTAERLYSQELNPNQQEIARNIFLRLTELGDGTQDTRRRATLQELYPPAPYGDPQDVKEVLVKLADARLIITGESTAEVAHEALIREWPTLREWLAQDREGLLVQRRLTEAAQEWQLLERDAGVLYRGARLAQALEWAQAHPQQLNAQEQVFLEASQEATLREQAEREAQRQRELDAARKVAEAERQRADAERQRAEEQGRSAQRLKRRAWQLAGVLVLALILAGAAILFGRQANANFQLADRSLSTAQSAEQQALSQQATAESERTRAEGEASQRATAQVEAENQRSEAEAQRFEARKQASIGLAAQALRELDTGRQDIGVLLALEALEKYPYTWQAEQALGQTVLKSRLRLVLQHENTAFSVKWSPDGKRLLTASADKSARVWDATTGEQLFQFDHQDQVNFALWSPDGSQILTSQDTPPIITVWDSHSGERLFDIEGHTALVNTARWSPDQDRIATASDDNTARIWDAHTGAEMGVLSGHQAWVQTLNWSPSGDRILTTSGDQTTIIWDAQTGKPVHILSGHTMYLSDVGQWSSSGDRILTSAADGTAKVWDADTGQEQLSIMVEPDFHVLSRWSPSGERILAGPWAGPGPKVYDAVTGEAQIALYRENPSVNLRVIAWSPTGDRILTALADGSASVWNASSGEELFTFRGHGAEITGYWEGCAAWSPDGQWVATCSTNGTAMVWDLSPVPTLLGHQSRAWAFWSSAGDRVLSVSGDQTAGVWDPSTATQLQVFGTGMPKGTIPYSSWSPSGDRFIMEGPGGKATIWDVTTGAELLTISVPGHDGKTIPAWSPDGSLIAIGHAYDGTIRLWDADSGVEQKTLYDYSSDGWWDWLGQAYINVLEWSPSGTRLLTNAWRTNDPLKVLDETTGEILFSNPPSGITASWSPDESRIASYSYEGIGNIRDAETGEKLLEFSGHGGYITGLAWSPTGERFASSSLDGKVSVRDAHSGLEVLRYPFGVAVNSVDWSPDGRKILVSYAGRIVILPVWNTTQELIDYAHECCVARELSPEDRVLYGLTPAEQTEE